MAEKREKLFEQFPPVSTAEWKAKVEADLKGALQGAVLLENTGRRIRVVSRRLTPDELLP